MDLLVNSQTLSLNADLEGNNTKIITSNLEKIVKKIINIIDLLDEEYENCNITLVINGEQDKLINEFVSKNIIFPSNLPLNKRKEAEDFIKSKLATAAYLAFDKYRDGITLTHIIERFFDYIDPKIVKEYSIMTRKIIHNYFVKDDIMKPEVIALYDAISYDLTFAKTFIKELVNDPISIKQLIEKIKEACQNKEYVVINNMLSSLEIFTQGKFVIKDREKFINLFISEVIDPMSKIFKNSTNPSLKFVVTPITKNKVITGKTTNKVTEK